MNLSSKLWKVLLVFAIVFSFVFTSLVNEADASNNLQVHFIDVGQGDAILVNLPNGQNMLVDGGENHYGTTVVNYIANRGISRLDYVVGTHPHSDHIGGLSDVINQFSIGRVYMPNVTANTKTYEDLLQAIDRKGLTITRARAGLTIVNTVIDGKRLQVNMIAPVRDSYSNINDYSAVMKISYGTTSFLLTGDAEHISEADMINSGVDLSASILKVGHHGSSTSTTDAFLNRVNPAVAVISVGAGNRYGHPTQTTINKLKARNIAIYRTDMNGSVVFTTTGSGWLVNKQAWWRP
ncbi:ComEC/Rec2 family competence protein [Halalkalibacter hemicellulosilyticus]|uniref:Metallo-beta-lactamase superfamily protein n=1 Tax=Halalkalibacter hemicellulosilyticusJCM 9152 TaxID=1236971 RepID=W4QBM2_9BACI|nr:ComEC/Rec2 family competence protein [Halalkalibacter hemicellulosilyticus]GAE29362.1 metallo-beta-lactamase superfamily protein [Halalkalibacter hemicellulosilyticusJCM 9152]